MSKLIHSDDRGAITTLFAILLGSGLLLAILGLVVDGGQVMIEKQLVRKGASAVAEAVGIHCAKTLPGTNCLFDSYQTINAYNGNRTATAANGDFLNSIANPKGGNLEVAKVCGQSAYSLGLPPCPPLTTSPNDCGTDLGSMSQYPNWVRVYVSSGSQGFQPVFESMLSDNPQSYQETSCSQVYWGAANGIAVDTTGNQLPFVFGLCDVQPQNFDKPIEIIGDQGPQSCTGMDRNGVAISSSTRGFMEFDPSATAGSCAILGSTGCSIIPLDSTKGKSGTTYPQLGYNGLIGALKTRLSTLQLKKTIMLPVVSQAGTAYQVKGFVGFTLLGFNFPTSSVLTAGTSTKTSYQLGTKTYCPGTPTATSSYCIAGQFNTRVYGTYGQVSGLGITTSSDVPNLGYQVIKHIR